MGALKQTLGERESVSAHPSAKQTLEVRQVSVCVLLTVIASIPETRQCLNRTLAREHCASQPLRAPVRLRPRFVWTRQAAAERLARTLPKVSALKPGYIY